MNVRFGLFGTGWWARDVHGPGLATCDGVDLVGVWGRNPAKREQLAARLGVPAYSSRSELLADVDAVSVALAPDIQCEVALEAAAAGKHLLLDKPLALDVDLADQLVRTIEAAELASVVFVTGRFQPAAEQVLERARQLGGWVGGRADIRVSVLADDKAVLQQSTWRVERGALWDAAPHALSPLVATLGPVTQVAAMTDERRTTFLTLRHESGCCSQVSTTLQAPAEAFAWDVELYGTHGRLGVPHDLSNAPQYYRRAVHELTDQIITGKRQHRIDARFARHLLAVVVGAETSIATGCEQTVRPFEHQPNRPPAVANTPDAGGTFGGVRAR